MSAEGRPFKFLPGRKVQLPPAPRFMSYLGGPSLATIYSSHFWRLQAVVAAARSGDTILIKLALDHHDKHGYSDA